MTRTIFDDFSRTNPDPATDREDSFTFLNRAATPYWDRIREFVEEAFAAYPDAQAPDLRARFRNRRWSEHAGAWWELYLFTLFRALGLDVDVHPELPGVDARPDFHVGTGDEAFLAEARHVAAGLRSGEGRAGRDSWITGPLDSLTHPNFMVAVHIVARDDRQPRSQAVTSGVLAWLDQYDPDEVTSRAPDEAPRFQGAAGGWRFELRAIPVKPEARGRPGRRLVGVYPAMSGMDNTVTALRTALKEKAAKYGRPETPFVLAPLLTSGFVDTEDVVGALFGTEALTFRLDAPEQATPIRRRDGFWIAGTGFRGTRVSAVLVGESIMPWTAARRLPRLWIHPGAAHPLASDLGLPTARLDADGRLILSDDDQMGADVFGLDDFWPGPEGPFEVVGEAGA